MENKKVPVTREGVEVGYTLDGGKTIQFYETPEAQKVISELNSGQMIGVSSRGIGEVIEGRIVKPIDVTELAFQKRSKQGILDMMNIEEGFNSDNLEPEYNESIESKLGAWELFKKVGSEVHQLRYWLPDGDYPQVVLNLTKEEFEDLETLFPNVKKYRSEK